VGSSGLDWNAVNEGGDLLVLVHPARAQEHGGSSSTSEGQRQPRPTGFLSDLSGPLHGEGPPEVGTAQPTCCPLPQVPHPRGPQPGEAAALVPLEGGNTTEPLSAMGKGCPGTPRFLPLAKPTRPQPAPLPGRRAHPPVREVVPVEIVVQLAVTAAGGGNRGEQVTGSAGPRTPWSSRCRAQQGRGTQPASIPIPGEGEASRRVPRELPGPRHGPVRQLCPGRGLPQRQTRVLGGTERAPGTASALGELCLERPDVKFHGPWLCAHAAGSLGSKLRSDLSADRLQCRQPTCR